MSARWEPCDQLHALEGRGMVRCWNPPLYFDLSDRGLCQRHASALVAERGLEALRPDSRERWLARDPEAPSTAAEAPGRRRALVIDDETPIRDLLGDLLRRLGFEADGAATGPEGLALLDRVGYDLVLTDLRMPGMTGWEVAEAIRERAPAVRVIMSTGSVSNLDMGRLRALSLTLLAKPFQLDDLRRAVEEALGTGVGAARPSVAGERGEGGEGAPATGEGRTDLLADVRAVLDTIRKAAGELEALLGAVERMAQLQAERESLRGQHEKNLRALAELRDRHEALQQEHRSTAETLEALARRLRG